MAKQNYSTHLYHHFLYHWDTAMKNWFDMAIQKKDALVPGNGYIHFWNGHARSVEELRLQSPWFSNRLGNIPFLL
jgi:hypothetical protein